MSFTKKLGVRSNTLAKPVIQQQEVKETVNLKQEMKLTGDCTPQDQVPGPCEIKECDSACGYFAGAYKAQLVQEFSVIFTNWGKYLQLLRALATPCPKKSDKDVNIFALDLEVLCKGKWLVNFFPGIPVPSADKADDKLVTQTSYDVQTTIGYLNALSGDDFVYSTQQLVITDTDVGSGVYAQLFERLGNQDLDIQGNYIGEDGLVVSLRVPPAQNTKLLKILRATVAELKSNAIGCYNCYEIDYEPLVDETCESAVLNCSWRYPCKCGKKDDSCKKPKHSKKRHSDDEDDDSDHSDDDSSDHESYSVQKRPQFSRMTLKEQSKLQCGCHDKH